MNAKTFLPLWLLLALVGCSQQPVQTELGGSASLSAPIIVATLSTNDCEALTAPTYTAAQVAVERGARYVRSGRLSPEAGDDLLVLGRQAKSDLDAACPGKRLDASRLAAANAAVEKMQTILGGVR
jgi:hypothetical protein